MPCIYLIIPQNKAFFRDMYRYKTFCPINNDLKIFVIFSWQRKNGVITLWQHLKNLWLRRVALLKACRERLSVEIPQGRVQRMDLWVAADGFRTRYQSGLYVSIRNERSVFPAIWVVPQDSKSCPIYGIRLFLFAY